jgi:hypothetical protein
MAGVAMLLGSISCDAVAPNLQERLLRRFAQPKGAVVLHTNWLSAALTAAIWLPSGEARAAAAYLSTHTHALKVLLLQSLAGYLGVLSYLGCIRYAGSKATVLVTTARKMFTIALSFCLFSASPFTAQHGIGLAIAVAGMTGSAVRESAAQRGSAAAAAAEVAARKRRDSGRTAAAAAEEAGAALVPASPRMCRADATLLDDALAGIAGLVGVETAHAHVHGHVGSGGPYFMKSDSMRREAVAHDEAESASRADASGGMGGRLERIASTGASWDGDGGGVSGGGAVSAGGLQPRQRAAAGGGDGARQRGSFGDLEAGGGNGGTSSSSSGSGLPARSSSWDERGGPVSSSAGGVGLGGRLLRQARAAAGNPVGLLWRGAAATPASVAVT